MLMLDKFNRPAFEVVLSGIEAESVLYDSKSLILLRGHVLDDISKFTFIVSVIKYVEYSADIPFDSFDLYDTNGLCIVSYGNSGWLSLPRNPIEVEAVRAVGAFLIRGGYVHVDTC